jgi:hypothetical protein
METVIGWEGEWDRDPRSTFLHPALWREQLPTLSTQQSEAMAA